MFPQTALFENRKNRRPLDDVEQVFIKNRARSYIYPTLWFLIFVTLVFAAVFYICDSAFDRKPTYQELSKYRNAAGLYFLSVFFPPRLSLGALYVFIFFLCASFIRDWHRIAKHAEKVDYDTTCRVTYLPNGIAVKIEAYDGERIVELMRSCFMNQDVFNAIKTNDRVRLTATPDLRFVFSAEKI